MRIAVRDYAETHFSAQIMAKNYTLAYQKVRGIEKRVALAHIPAVEPSSNFEIMVP